MKKIFLSFMIFSLVLSYFGMGVVDTVYASDLQKSTDAEIQAVATELYNLLNVEKPEVASAVSAYKSAKYLDFLKIVRNMIMDNIYSKSLNKFMWQAPGQPTVYDTDYADVYIGKMSVEDFNKKYEGWPIAIGVVKWGVIGDPKIPIKPDFMAEPVNNNNGYLNFSNFSPLAKAYFKTKDPIYLRKWEQIMTAYSDLFFNQARELLKTVPVSLVTDMRPLDYGYSTALCASWRIDFTMKQLAVFVKSLPGTGYKTQDFYTILDPIDGKLDKESYDIMDPVAFAKYFICMDRDHFDYAYKSYIEIKRPEVPNQVLAALCGMTNISRMADIFKDIDERRQGLDNKVLIYFTDYVQKDGSHSEQSFNYNTLSLGDFNLIKEYAKEQLNNNPKLQIIYSVLDNSTKMFQTLSNPLGVLPNVGGGFGIPPYRAWESDELYKKAFEVGSGGEGVKLSLPYSYENFTSVAFPYGGYYALRSSWDKDSTYLFTQNARRTFGHMYVSNNSIELMSKRRNLIMGGGLTHYTEQDSPADIREKYFRPMVQYFGEDANMSRSTIVVDGLPQARGTSIYIPWLPTLSPVKDGVAQGVKDFEAIPSKWSDSGMFTYHEGLYDAGYIATSTTSHYRQIIMIKPLELVLVSDIMGMKDGENHKISQVWCFPPYVSKTQKLTYKPYTSKVTPTVEVPGFKEEEVNYNTDDRLLSTSDPTGPNVFLKNFSNYTVDAKKYYGYVPPTDSEYYLGWYAPGDVKGYRYPKVDYHMNYSATSNTTPLVTAISSSFDTKNTIGNYEDLSTNTYSGFKGVTNNKIVTYLSSRNPVNLQADKISVNAKTLVTVQDGNKISGIVTDCTKFTFNGENKEISSSSVEFEINSGEFKAVQFVEEANSFRWLQYDNGIKPVINMLSEAELIKISKNINNYAKRMTTTSYAMRSYTQENMNNGINYAIKNVNSIINSGSGFGQNELVKEYINFIGAVRKEIALWKNAQDKKQPEDMLKKLSLEIQTQANNKNLDNVTKEVLNKLANCFE
jgi:hypothetical protein